MLEKKIAEILRSYREGGLTEESATDELRKIVYESLGFATVDHHRTLRHGIPEVVYGEHKTEEEIFRIVEAIAKRSGRVLVTRVSPEKAEVVLTRFSEGTYHERGRILTVGPPMPREERVPPVLVVSAGTSDAAVAEEAYVTAEFFGNDVRWVRDVGVAGLHRITDKVDLLEAAGIIIVVAGMEGALPSVVAGISGKPVVAVPTSVGYGASFGGITPLLAMLNSCAPGVVVVNIDNGFGAAYFATILNRVWRRAMKSREEER